MEELEGDKKKKSHREIPMALYTLLINYLRSGFQAFDT